MSHYLIKIIFYTGGVIGFLLIAYIVAKYCLMNTGSFRKKTGNLDIEESLAISPKKTLHIIKAFDERFLIASDANSTTLLAKLNSDESISENIQQEFSSYIEEKPTKTTQENSPKNSSVIKSMLEKLNN